MSLTYFETEDAIVTISDAAQAKYDAEQSMDNVVGVHTAILIGASIGLVVTFGVLVFTKIFGA